MKKPTDRAFVKAYMLAVNAGFGWAAVLRSLHGSDTATTSPLYAQAVNRANSLRSQGVNLPPFRQKPLTKEAEKLNELIEEMRE
jgi:hypothetical protein